MSNEQNNQKSTDKGMEYEPLLSAVNDSIEFIADSLGNEVQLRQMIDSWCIEQLGNTEEALDKADAMFTAARDIFYGNGR